MWLLSCICRRRLPLSLSSLLGRKLVSNCWQMSFRLRGRFPACSPCCFCCWLSGCLLLLFALASGFFFFVPMLHARTVSKSLLICCTSGLPTFYYILCVFVDPPNHNAYCFSSTLHLDATHQNKKKKTLAIGTWNRTADEKLPKHNKQIWAFRWSVHSCGPLNNRLYK